jgi:regulator of protease activity HflC (stomatin/prohibitin superfamily)
MSTFALALLILIGLTLFLCYVIVPQGTVAVVTVFGKYRRIMAPGLNFKLPFIETVYKRISIQNRSLELNFQAITVDQANVNFKAMLVYAAFDQSEEAIKNVAFKFAVEGSIRAFVATQRQAAVLSLRGEIVLHVKDQLDATLESWGYHLIDLQLNDIAFDEEIMRSMAKVVASNNLKAAAENEGQALLITKTKAAEAEGNAIKIAAEAEKIAAQLRGQGVALFREEVTKGLAHAMEEMTKNNLDPAMVYFSMWTEAIKHFAEQGKGNVIFLDGSNEGMSKSLQQMMAMQQLERPLK